MEDFYSTVWALWRKKKQIHTLVRRSGSRFSVCDMVRRIFTGVEIGEPMIFFGGLSSSGAEIFEETFGANGHIYWWATSNKKLSSTRQGKTKSVALSSPLYNDHHIAFFGYFFVLGRIFKCFKIHADMGQFVGNRAIKDVKDSTFSNFDTDIMLQYSFSTEMKISQFWDLIVWLTKGQWLSLHSGNLAISCMVCKA